MKLLLVTLLFLLSKQHVRSQDFENVVSHIAPLGIGLGTSVGELKRLRSDVYDGPYHNGKTNGQGSFISFQEIEGIGRPGYTTFWYFCQNDVITGIYKITSFLGVKEEAATVITQREFNLMNSRLENHGQESILRKGEKAFVSIPVDIWHQNNSNKSSYFFSTNKEMVQAIFSTDNLPLDEVFIHPNSARFPLEDKGKETVYDINHRVIE